MALLKVYFMPTYTRSPKLKQNETPTHKNRSYPQPNVSRVRYASRTFGIPRLLVEPLPTLVCHREKSTAYHCVVRELAPSVLQLLRCFRTAAADGAAFFRGRHGWPLVHRSSTKTLIFCSRQQQRLWPKKRGHCVCGRSELAEDSTNNIVVVLIPKATNQARPRRYPSFDSPSLRCPSSLYEGCTCHSRRSSAGFAGVWCSPVRVTSYLATAISATHIPVYLYGTCQMHVWPERCKPDQKRHLFLLEVGKRAFVCLFNRFVPTICLK